MIAIKVRLELDKSPHSNFDSWEDQVTSAGLFGRVLIETGSSNSWSDLVKLIAGVSGRLDLFVSATELSVPQGIELLNAGANRIIVPFTFLADWGAHVPAERLLISIDDPAQAQAPAEIDRGQFGWWLRAGRIDVSWRQTAKRQLVIAAPDAGQGDEWKSPSQLVAVFDEQAWHENPQQVSSWLFSRLTTDRADGLVPTVITDPLGIALGLAYSNAESFAAAVARREGVYWSRSRGGLWIKGETSGSRQRLLRIDSDCDRDCLRFTVDQLGEGFCHQGTYSCFGADRNLSTIVRGIHNKIVSFDPDSFSRRLAGDPELLADKLIEEANELLKTSTRADAAWEAADVLYFTLIGALRSGADLADVAAELGRRMNRLVRRD
ncbi:MAG TPA: phosphoribosyl-AMP cyclohydrolase [Pirellulaceae bacterium]|nr:phosphoribosyl-AMP cyclohydrolase [Pirellulaceae bacterium]